MKAVRRRAAWAALATMLLTVAAACGGSDAAEEPDEIEGLAEELKSLKPGEVLIKGRRSPKFSGPHEFQPGGYVLRFSQEGGSPGLTVSLESTGDSKRPPYQLVVDTKQAAGRAAVTVRGRLYVHVVSSAESYELRFTPKRAS